MRKQTEFWIKSKERYMWLYFDAALAVWCKLQRGMKNDGGMTTQERETTTRPKRHPFCPFCKKNAVVRVRQCVCVCVRYCTNSHVIIKVYYSSHTATSHPAHYHRREVQPPPALGRTSFHTWIRGRGGGYYMNTGVLTVTLTGRQTGHEALCDV